MGRKNKRYRKDLHQQAYEKLNRGSPKKKPSLQELQRTKYLRTARMTAIGSTLSTF